MKHYFRIILLIGLLAALSLAAPLVASGQQQDNVKVTLTPYEGNPILTPDETLDWEVGGVVEPRVIYHDGLFHMFYKGYTKDWTVGGVGYATSQDGLLWTKYEDNPVFVPDETLAPNGVMTFTVFLDGETWMLYFTPWLKGRTWWDIADDTLVATAASPTGPWTVASEPALTGGKLQDWDWGGHWVYTVTRARDEYFMFFESNDAYTVAIGMATSPDGIHWTKYDDPATTSNRRAASDPVFEHSVDLKAWDGQYVASPVVRLTDKGWEMFYGGGDSVATRCIGYATSPDGITWTRQGDTPLLKPALPANEWLIPGSLVEVEGTTYLYYDHFDAADEQEPFRIAVATITYQ